ncbi:uncharacterized protein LOC127750810 [Frankliniella occidentalis]|uniref:Uncharacterized protein LOC127750810 n=1 Tax=Frankliniella occidentalis TaxID=133901 RepID=A0A9C6X540_FRAOC|nr:uncharacterized protein LOC127750810 [Frankliniella occidentalis]
MSESEAPAAPDNEATGVSESEAIRTSVSEATGMSDSEANSFTSGASSTDSDPEEDLHEDSDQRAFPELRNLPAQNQRRRGGGRGRGRGRPRGRGRGRRQLGRQPRQPQLEEPMDTDDGLGEPGRRDHVPVRFRDAEGAPGQEAAQNQGVLQGEQEDHVGDQRRG